MHRSNGVSSKSAQKMDKQVKTENTSLKTVKCRCLEINIFHKGLFEMIIQCSLVSVKVQISYEQSSLSLPNTCVKVCFVVQRSSAAVEPGLRFGSSMREQTQSQKSTLLFRNLYF